MKQRRKVGIGLLGSGVVGEAIQDMLLGSQKTGELEIRRIFTRQPKGKKWFAKKPELFTAKAEEVLDDPRIEIVVEALGFQKPAELAQFRDYFLRAFRNGKAVVTSDKAVLARFGKEIWAAAAEHGQELRFEACVGGGIPIIRALSESFAAEEPQAIFGIVNGTCNYILSRMEKGQRPYSEALAEAQQKGYAETNPESDVSGKDAEAKLLLLCRVAFAMEIAPGTIWRKGIEDIHAVDFRYAGKTGASTIKQLAVAKRMGSTVQVFVSPVLMPRDNFLASIDGPTNAICFAGAESSAARGERDCDYVLVGPGAGGGPTAVAVLGDVYDLARRGRNGIAAPALSRSGSLKLRREADIEGSWYIRFIVQDRAGIVGDIGRTFGRIGVNISEIWQLRHSETELRELAQSYKLRVQASAILPFVITLETATLQQVRRALESLRDRDYIVVEPVWFPIWAA